MKIQLNGNEEILPDGTTVLGLIRRLELRPEQVAIERNHELVKRAEHAQTVLQDGDAVEVVTLVGGG